jgi:hypothetical protein
MACGLVDNLRFNLYKSPHNHLWLCFRDSLATLTERNPHTQRPIATGIVRSTNLGCYDKRNSCEFSGNEWMGCPVAA